MDDDDGNPIFAFHDLEYIPYGFSSDTAPYIETPAGTMRAAAALMRLSVGAGADEAAATHQEDVKIVICDLGCGDGYFLLSLLDYLQKTTTKSTTAAQGVGIDYDAALINTAGINSASKGLDVQWLIYNFNEDQDDLVGQLTITHHVTHVFIYLVPKQLALQSVRRILTRLCESGVVLCCHKFYPEYLTPARYDVLMDLKLYDETSYDEHIT